MASVEKREGKRGTTYRVRYTDPEGRERSKSFKRKADANDFRIATEHGIRSGVYVDPRAGRVTVRAYLEAWRVQQSHHRPKTADTTAIRFRTMVYPILGDTPISNVKPSTIREWQAQLLAEGRAPSTIRGVRGQMAGAFRDAMRDRLLGSSPFEGVKAPEVLHEEIVPLTPAKVRAGIAAAPERYRALLVLVAGTGLRAGEAWGLTRDRLDLEARVVRVDRQLARREGRAPVFGPPKSRASVRTVPLSDAVVAAMREHLRKYPAGPHELVFRTAQGTPLTRTVWGRAWRPAAAAMGLPTGKGLHQLRHFYASLLIEGGRSVKEVQERLGHASADETLNTYSHLFPDSADGTREVVDAVFAPVGVGH